MEAPSSTAGAGVTFERKKELTKALNDKIKLFVEHIEAKKIETPSKEPDLDTLWKRFESARNRKGLNIKEAW